MIGAGIVLLILVPYFLWHEPMDAYFESPQFAAWVASVKPYAWAVAIVLLVADLLLPVPTSPLVATAGTTYGTFWGGVVGAVGSFLAGLVAYALARLAGRKAGRLLADEEEMADLQHFFDTWGVGGIIASRAMPVVPEVLTFIAGPARMNLGRFTLALAIGAIPMGFLLAWAGSAYGYFLDAAAGADTGAWGFVVRLPGLGAVLAGTASTAGSHGTRTPPVK